MTQHESDIGRCGDGMCNECIDSSGRIERVETRASDARRAMGYNEIAFGNSRSRGRHAFASPISPRSPRIPGTARVLPTPSFPSGLPGPSSPRTPRTPRGTRVQQVVDMEHSASPRTSSAHSTSSADIPNAPTQRGRDNDNVIKGDGSSKGPSKSRPFGAREREALLAAVPVHERAKVRKVLQEEEQLHLQEEGARSKSRKPTAARSSSIERLCPGRCFVWPSLFFGHLSSADRCCVVWPSLFCQPHRGWPKF
jgi:hypothetical protein